jgi:hypothetical protein
MQEKRHALLYVQIANNNYLAQNIENTEWFLSSVSSKMAVQIT